MKRLVVLGAGTAGTIAANKLRARLPEHEWTVTAVDRDDVHRYQPGYLFLPFGIYRPDQVTRSRRRYLRDGVELVTGEVEAVSPATSTVSLSEGRELPYDMLVLATGTSPRPDQTQGMYGPLWRSTIHEFYSYEGAMALAAALPKLERGRLVVHVTDVPVKCPVAPLEFAFLADDWLRHHGRRNAVDIVFVTPQSGAFTRPVAAHVLGSMLDDRDIRIESDFMVERVDEQSPALVSYDERRVPFDLLVTVPLNMGANFVGQARLGDELNYARVNRHTLQSLVQSNIFAIGDATDVPTSKAGSVAHFEVDVLVANVLDTIRGEPPGHAFDGHASCFVETGGGKALLLDFDYVSEPSVGRYPFPTWGPLTLLRESRRNHWAKLAFRWLYWNALLPGRPLPLRPSALSSRHALAQ